MPTKDEIIQELDEMDYKLDELEERDAPAEPGHDLFRAIRFGYCMDCGNRYCDTKQGETCSTCQPVTAWLIEWEDEYIGK